MNKQGKGNAVLWVLVTLLIAMVVMFGAFMWYSLSGGQVPQGIPGSTTTTTLPGCGVEDTTVTLSAIDKYLSTGVGGTHRYSLNGGASKTVSDAGTLTASPGDKIEVVWNNASTTGYFSKVGSYVVPCKGTYTPNDESGNAVILSKNGTITATLFNNLDQVTDGALTNFTISNGDVKTGKLKLQGDYQRDFPYGMVAVVEYNKTAIDNIILLNNGVELPSAVVPSSFAITLGTESTTKAYQIPPVLSNAEYNYQITVDADDTQNPGAIADANAQIDLYSLNYYFDDKDGNKVKGPAVQDEYDSLTRSGRFTVNVYLG